MPFTTPKPPAQHPTNSHSRVAIKFSIARIISNYFDLIRRMCELAQKAREMLIKGAPRLGDRMDLVGEAK